MISYIFFNVPNYVWITSFFSLTNFFFLFFCYTDLLCGLTFNLWMIISGSIYDMFNTSTFLFGFKNCMSFFLISWSRLTLIFNRWFSSPLLILQFQINLVWRKGCDKGILRIIRSSSSMLFLYIVYPKSQQQFTYSGLEVILNLHPF